MLALISFICNILAFIFFGVVLGPFLSNLQFISTADMFNSNIKVVEEALGSSAKVINIAAPVFFYGLLAPLDYIIAFFRLKEAQVDKGV